MVTPERTGAQERQTQAPPLLRVTALPDLQEGWVGGLPGQVCESETQREGSSKLAQDFWEKTLCRGSQPLSAQRQVDPHGDTMLSAAWAKFSSLHCVPEKGKSTKGRACPPHAPQQQLFSKRPLQRPARRSAPRLVTCHRPVAPTPPAGPRPRLDQITRVAQDATARSHFLTGDSTAHYRISAAIHLPWQGWRRARPALGLPLGSRPALQGEKHRSARSAGQPCAKARRVCTHARTRARAPPRRGRPLPRALQEPRSGGSALTFDGDDVLPDLVLQHRLLHALQQLVDGVDVGVDRLEALDLGPDGSRVGQLLLVVHGAGAAPGAARPPPPPPSRAPGPAGRRAWGAAAPGEPGPPPAAGGGGARRKERAEQARGRPADSVHGRDARPASERAPAPRVSGPPWSAPRRARPAPEEARSGSFLSRSRLPPLGAAPPSSH